MLIRGEEWVITLDAAALHIFIPAGRIVCFYQRGLTLPSGIELDFQYGILQNRANGNTQYIQLKSNRAFHQAIYACYTMRMW